MPAFLVTMLAASYPIQITELEQVQQLQYSLYVYMIPVLLLSTLFMGPASAGFSYVVRNFSREEHAWVISDYFSHFKKNLKQSLIVYAIDMVLIFIFYVNVSFYSQMADTNTFYFFMRFFMYVVFVIYIMMHMYMHQMLVTFEVTIKQLFKNSLLLAFAKLPMNFVIIGLVFVLGFGLYFSPVIVIVLTFVFTIAFA